jgi:hypothetical protein
VTITLHMACLSLSECHLSQGKAALQQEGLRVRCQGPWPHILAMFLKSMGAIVAASWGRRRVTGQACDRQSHLAGRRCYLGVVQGMPAGHCVKTSCPVPFLPSVPVSHRRVTPSPQLPPPQKRTKDALFPCLLSQAEPLARD